MKINYSKLGLRISQRRRELNIRQKHLSKIISVSSNHMSNIENGHSIPSLETFVKICEALEITPDYLLLGNLRTKNIPKNIYDNLLLCNEKSLALISQIVEFILNNQRENSDKTKN